MLHQPISLARDGDDTVLIHWDDETQTRWTAQQLRSSCPCATCREKSQDDPVPRESRSLPIISVTETKPLRIDGMQPVGNYAYQVKFSDGHDSGLFTFQMLREGFQRPGG